MYDNKIENSFIGRIDGYRRREAASKKRIIPPLAPKDCRDCAYARALKTGVVACGQQMWELPGNNLGMRTYTYPSVSSFMSIQRREAEKCVYFHPMTEAQDAD